MFKILAPILFLVLISLGLAVPPVVAHAQAAPAAAVRPPDRDGSISGTIDDITAKTAGKPTLEEVASTVGHNKVAINLMWTLLAGFLVMFMQPGFAAVETGFTRAKNVAHTMSMNLMVYPLGMLGFYVLGFAIMMGGVGALGTMGGYGRAG